MSGYRGVPRVLFLALFLVLGGPLASQEKGSEPTPWGDNPLVMAPERVAALLAENPACLEGYKPLQSGPLLRLNDGGEPTLDTTFVVEPMQFESEGVRISGWLYLPETEGPYPLVVLTNGGGNQVRAVRSLSDFIAPILSHCGIAAFVHDKRGTGDSEGVFRDTDYEDYITDTGNAGTLLARDPRFDPTRIGVMGGSEGGRIAVLAASRYPVFRFAISYAGPVTDMVEDRILAQFEHLRVVNATPEERRLAEPVMREEVEAWQSGDPEAHRRVDEKILALRKTLRPSVLPATRAEMLSGAFDHLLPTWNSLHYDFVTEMESFHKPWLAIFGAQDGTVPPEPHILEIIRTTALSGNPDVTVAVLPRCGHAPVDLDTGRRVHFEGLILPWLVERGIGGSLPGRPPTAAPPPTTPR